MTGSLRFALVVAALSGVAGGCGRPAATPAPTNDPTVQTIEQTTAMPALPLPADTANSPLSSTTPALVDLPFTPAISMDPVDGGKISITPDTPVAEFKDRLFYFRNEENHQAFLRNPEKYARGSLSRY